MPLDNPAARLHVLFTAVSERQGPQVGVSSAWAGALSVDEANVTTALTGVAGLVAELGRVVEGLGDDHALGMYRHFAPGWARSIIFPDNAMNTSSAGLVDQGHLAALGGLAALLASNGIGAKRPEPEEIERARSALEDALAEVRKTREIPAAARLMMAARLHDILWAIDNLEMGGPDGVLAATERLAGAMNLNIPAEASKTSVMARVIQAANIAWSVFRAGETVYTSIEGWGDTGALLLT